MKVYEESLGLFTGVICGRKEGPNATVSPRYLDVSTPLFRSVGRYLKYIYRAIAEFSETSFYASILWKSRRLGSHTSQPSSVCVRVVATRSISVFDRVYLPERNNRLEDAPLNILSDMLSPLQHSPQLVLDCKSLSLLAVGIDLAVFGHIVRL
jgi:hypothetical protein